jgi:hypothetical protein
MVHHDRVWVKRSVDLSLQYCIRVSLGTLESENDQSPTRILPSGGRSPRPSVILSAVLRFRSSGKMNGRMDARFDGCRQQAAGILQHRLTGRDARKQTIVAFHPSSSSSSSSASILRLRLSLCVDAWHAAQDSMRVGNIGCVFFLSLDRRSPSWKHCERPRRD